ncbi:MAG: SCO family protein [Planctomycetota bacterium]|nr:SCO family protein [Planctomycetota bacterium]
MIAATGINRALIAALVLPALPGWVAPVAAQAPLLTEDTPEALEDVTIIDRTGNEIPLDLSFVDESGKSVALADYFRPGRPVILTLNYYRCPMLCTLTLNGMVDALNEIDWAAGEDFDIVTVSINPEEGPELATMKKKGYLTQYDCPTAAEGWHFLTGEQANIEKLATAVGFKYRYVEETGEYAHAASIMFITPGGKVSRYMNDVMFDPKAVRLALVEASEGSIGSPVDRFMLMMCYHYDPEAGSYAFSAMKLMRLVGLLTMLAIGVVLLVLWRRGPKHEPAPAVAGAMES